MARTGDTARVAPPVSIAALLDSATYSLPDTSEFTVKKYRVHFTPDYVARPSIGYARDNFGRGFFGGTAVSLSDILGNHQLVFAGYVNGRISEAQVLAAYANLSHRINWVAGISQEPYYFYEPSEIRVGEPTPVENTFVTNVRRLVVRSVFGQAYYPINRFQRIEGSLRFANVDDAILSILEPYNPQFGFATEDPTLETNSRPGRQLPAALDGAGVRQFTVRLHRPLLWPALAAGVRSDHWRLEVRPGHGRLSPLRPDRRSSGVLDPAALLRPDRSRRRSVPHLRWKHRSHPGKYLGLLPATRVPQRQRHQHPDRLRRSWTGWSEPSWDVASAEIRFPILTPHSDSFPRASRRSKAPSSTTSG